MNAEGDGRTVRWLVAIDDCENIISPMTGQGQIHGVDTGTPNRTTQRISVPRGRNSPAGSVMDYLVPTAVETPPREMGHTVTPSPHHPLGAKAVGESATVEVPPAIANAVLDGLARLGATHMEIPIGPSRHGYRGWSVGATCRLSARETARNLT